MIVEPEELEKKVKNALLTLIDLSNSEVIKSEAIKNAVYHAIKPGYLQIIYNEILEALAKKGFAVSDEYFTASIEFLEKLYSKEYVVDPQKYLRNLYNNFSNQSIGTNKHFPEIEKAKEIKKDTPESDELFKLIITNLDRTYITAVNQIDEPEKIVGQNYSTFGNKPENITAKMRAGNILLSEIVRYIGNLSGNQILKLVDRYPIINLNYKWYNSLGQGQSILTIAMDFKDIKLCKGLIKRGASIVCYDENGHDITSKKFDQKHIEVFMKLNPEYNPDQEFDSLLLAIGGNNGPKRELTKPL